MMLSALGVTAVLLPASFGDAQGTAADPPPVGAGFLGAAPALAPAGSAAAALPRRRPASAPPAGPSRRPSAAGVSSPTPRPPSRTAASGDAAQEDQVTVLVNQERAKAGCGALRTDERLRTAARGHSRDMAVNDYFDHTAPDGSTFVDRAAAAGYPRNQAGGENIAMGYRTPAEVMDGWMNSAGHRANILNCDFAAIGVGLARDSRGTAYWTQVFGRA